MGYLLSIPRSDDPFDIYLQMGKTSYWVKIAWISAFIGIGWSLFGTYPASQLLPWQLYYDIYAVAGNQLYTMYRVKVKVLLLNCTAACF